MQKRIVFRDEKTGRFTRRHSQKYIRPELIDDAGRYTAIGNYRRGIDAFDAWTLEQTYAAPVFAVQPEIVLRSFKSVHRTLQPVEAALGTYKLVDVEVWYRGERIVALAKIPLRKTRRKVTKRWTHREANETPLGRVRMEIKRALENLGYAVTSRDVRIHYGDKRTRAYAVPKYDPETEVRLDNLKARLRKTRKRSERTAIERDMSDARAAGTVEREGLKTIKPKIIIRGYK